MSKRKSIEDLFKGRQFEREIIILCVRWYLRYKLFYRDLVETGAARAGRTAEDSQTAILQVFE